MPEKLNLPNVGLSELFAKLKLPKWDNIPQNGKLERVQIYDKEYSEELIRRFNEGGTIWLIERTDTNEFYYPPMTPHIHTFGRGYAKRYCQWHKEISMFVAASGFLSKEDAEKYSWHRDGFERGCSNCGHGGIPIKFTEHEFVPSSRGGGN